MIGSKTRRTRIVLGVTGSIASYKAVDIARYFMKRGCDVRVVMTESATKFIAPLTFQALSRNPVTVSFWNETESGNIGHIELADWADAIVIAPATAECIAKLTIGSAETTLLAVALATRSPLAIAPAMNTNMLKNQQTQDNIAALRKRGHAIVESETGELACGWVGSGRLASKREIYLQTMRMIGPKDLIGKHIVISAGPTREMIDPVRYISNRSSGRMGVALANEAHRRGAVVTLVHGPIMGIASLSRDIRRIAVTSSAEMSDAMKNSVAGLTAQSAADVAIMAAAVADYRPAKVDSHKIKKCTAAPNLSLIENEDILRSLALLRQGGPHTLLVGFAVETGSSEELVAEARAKLSRKGVDLIVGNRAEDAFDKGTNQVWIVSVGSEPVHIQTSTKRVIARAILDQVVARLSKEQNRELTH
jgi:phosphopantothenoylcysteine decarboxylase/phosphopantothenate--cysteine ligase